MAEFSIREMARNELDTGLGGTGKLATRFFTNLA